ncbi:hypothetical protein [Sediminibacterium soli]|uniref:hypothetical protein n=1 Tax=Sediminibacterium soli TaxID=2698829 RepID=UPI0013798737|nr:hypothetical protein [Sediminibacterium soli]NCI47922.1 hypothetical protein [Sediminibacterium soli]
MNPEKTILPDFLIAELYKNSLVILDGGQPVEETIVREEPVSVPEKKEKQWFLGSNVQKITLVVNEKEAAYLADDSLKFLTSILGACKLNLGDVAIVNYRATAVDYAQVKEQLAPRSLILFGVSAQALRLPFTIPDYQVQSYDQCQFLIVPPLEKMLGDSQEAKLEKSKLWLCLKKIFHL